MDRSEVYVGCLRCLLWMVVYDDDVMVLWRGSDWRGGSGWGVGVKGWL